MSASTLPDHSRPVLNRDVPDLIRRQTLVVMVSYALHSETTKYSTAVLSLYESACRALVTEIEDRLSARLTPGAAADERREFILTHVNGPIPVVDEVPIQIWAEGHQAFRNRILCWHPRNPDSLFEFESHDFCLNFYHPKY